MPLDILYEDDSLIFIDKPPGIVVQRGYDPDEPVLFDQVQKMLAEKGEGSFMLQRLDRGTSGVILFTKRPEVNPAMTRFFEKKRITKSYVALAHGGIAEEQTIDAPLTRVGPISFGVRDTGKRAVTHIHPRSTNTKASFIALTLETGRTHQIRVHMAAIGHPLVGDWLYGQRDAVRPMLHSASITLPHPVTGAVMTISALPPGDFVSEASVRGLSIAW